MERFVWSGTRRVVGILVWNGNCALVPHSDLCGSHTNTLARTHTRTHTHTNAHRHATEECLKVLHGTQWEREKARE